VVRESKRSRQGIHDISLILGIEATRNLEEETFQGVRDVSADAC
jgi:uracil phosphoribosyltransferase